MPAVLLFIVSLINESIKIANKKVLFASTPPSSRMRPTDKYRLVYASDNDSIWSANTSFRACRLLESIQRKYRTSFWCGPSSHKRWFMQHWLLFVWTTWAKMVDSVKQVHLNNEDEGEKQLSATTHTTGCNYSASLPLRGKTNTHPPCCPLGGSYAESGACTLSPW